MFESLRPSTRQFKRPQPRSVAIVAGIAFAIVAVIAVNQLTGWPIYWCSSIDRWRDISAGTSKEEVLRFLQHATRTNIITNAMVLDPVYGGESGLPLDRPANADDVNLMNSSSLWFVVKKDTSHEWLEIKFMNGRVHRITRRRILWPWYLFE